MATEILLIKDKNRLAAADPISQETLDGMRQGETVTATIRRPRNPRQHRLLFALLQTVFENQERYKAIEQLLDAVKIAVGHCELLPVKLGAVTLEVPIPRSISFAKMPQDKFETFFRDALDYIVRDVIPGLDKATLEREVYEMIH